MTIDIKQTNRQWSFLKVDQEAAYKQLPIDPEQTKYATAALRHPHLNTWYAFRQTTLLFGSEADVIRYNCFSRVIAILVNRIFGIPLVSYYDDLGAPIPSDLGDLALTTTQEFLRLVAVFLNTKKTDMGEEVAFLGLLGRFPNPGNDMTLSIALPEDKKTNWATIIDKIPTLGVVQHSQLESLIGKLSFSQTSIFGRFGRPMLTPLQIKLNARHFRTLLSDREIRIPQWWASGLKGMGPAPSRPARADRIW